MAVEVNPYRKLTDSGEYYIANFYNLDPFVKDSLIRSNIINAKLNLPLEDYCRVITEYNQKTWLQYLNRNHQSLFEDHSMVISVLEKKPEVLIPYILSLSSLYLGWNKVTESYTLAQFAINKSLEQKEYFLLAKSYLQAGKSCSLKGDKLDAFRFLLKSKEICNQYNFNSLESEIWHVIGEYYHQLNSHLNSYEAFCSAEECIKKIEPVDTSILYLIYISKLEVMHSIDPSKFNEQEVYKILNWARTNNDKILEDKTAATLRHIYIETSNLKKIRLYYEVIAPQELNQLKTTNSFMYNKIVLENGGGYGYTDYIAQALGVAPGEWAFTESDIPTNMHYNVATMVGLNIRYSVDKKNSILMNVNGSKIIANGNFTMTTTNNTAPIGTIPRNIQTFGIRGVEQRLLFQFGYQHLFGDDPKIQLLLEGGLNVTFAKFDKNEILINYLRIDLTSSYDVAGTNVYMIRKPRGTGYGAFAGLGGNISIDKRWRIQILYIPTLENVNMGEETKLKLQHGIGLRAYGNFN